MRRLFLVLLSALVWALPGLGLVAAAADSSTSPAPGKSAEKESGYDEDDLLEAGRQLFEEHAPAAIKEQLEFPSRQQWNEFTGRLQKALGSGSLEELAAFEPEARRALSALRLMPDYSDYADWLAERLDLIEAARKAADLKPTPKRPAPAATPASPNEPKSAEEPVQAVRDAVPYYNLWLEKLQDRPKPTRADEFIPLLKMIFQSEGLPPELAWLAEVESSLNPSALSPAGARGLFQLMPATARSLGLSLLPSDERTQPGKNARAAAKLLRLLHTRFDSWPLALAAYNAGEGRIARALDKKNAVTFADIADALPAETRMYVPKFFATVAVREKINPDKLAQPPPAEAGKSAVNQDTSSRRLEIALESDRP
jgi:membrane-bound lytic murein transglycosylase D